MSLKQVYNILLKTYGSQSWWPAKTKLEMIVGAILTQNTAWTNVEKAIKKLKHAKLLTLKTLHQTPVSTIAKAIKPSGFFNQKARRLKDLITYIFTQHKGQLAPMLNTSLNEAREEWLNLKGIGPETADSILLYAGNRPTFVIDAYTRRIFKRLGLLPKADQMTYKSLQQYFQSHLPKNTQLFNEYHALIVHHAKQYCRKKPLCNNCPLTKTCAHSLSRPHAT